MGGEAGTRMCGLVSLSLCVLLLLIHSRVKVVKAFADTLQSPTFQNIPGGTYAIWQIPAQPRAILFVAHGRSHERAENFWDATPACAVCSSLPEERLVTKAALARGYAVISIQASASGGSEWILSPDPDENQDVRMVVRFLQQWRREQRLEHLPVTVMGVSHGGSFASVLALAPELRIAGMLFMVSMGEDSAAEAAQAGSYPPVSTSVCPGTGAVTRKCSVTCESSVPRAFLWRTLSATRCPSTRRFLQRGSWEWKLLFPLPSTRLCVRRGIWIPMAS